MAGINTKEFNEDTFDEGIADGVVLVDFWAPWCGPCQMQGPIIDKVADSVGDKAVVAKCNVDEAQSIAAKFGIQSIPALILFKNGEEIKRMVGLQQEASLISEINNLC